MLSFDGEAELQVLLPASADPQAASGLVTAEWLGQVDCACGSWRATISCTVSSRARLCWAALSEPGLGSGLK